MTTIPDRALEVSCPCGVRWKVRTVYDLAYHPVVNDCPNIVRYEYLGNQLHEALRGRS